MYGTHFCMPAVPQYTRDDFSTANEGDWRDFRHRWLYARSL